MSMKDLQNDFKVSALSIDEPDFEQSGSTGTTEPKHISKYFKRQGRYCWGGLSKKAYICFMSLGLTAFLIAIFVPVALFVFMPIYAQSTINKSKMTATELQINTWSTTPGSVEEDLWGKYLPWFSKVCNNSALVDKETFLESNVLQTLECAIMGTLEQEKNNATAASSSEEKSKRGLPVGLEGSLIQNLLPKVIPILTSYLDFPSDMNFKSLLDSLDVGSCSIYNPNLVTSVIRVDFFDVPAIMKGEIKECYYELSNPNFYADRPWGKIAMPALNLNNEEDGRRVIHDVEVQIRIYDRVGYLLNNIGLLNFAPLNQGTVDWLQTGNVTLTVDLGAKYTFPMKINNTITLGPSKFNAGPFSVPDPDIGNLKVTDIYSLLSCFALDIFAAINPDMGEYTYTLTEILAAAMVGLPDFEEIILNTPQDVGDEGDEDSLAKAQAKYLSDKIEYSLVPTQAYAYTDEYTLSNDTFSNFKVCNMTSKTDCKLSDFLTNDKMEGKELGYLVYPGNVINGDDTQCLYGSPWGFTVQKAPSTSTINKVLVYFQGGGADFNSVLNDVFDLLSVVSKTTPKSMSRTEALPGNQGVHNTFHPNNPFKDYTIVTVLYCSGDIYMSASKWSPAWHKLLKIPPRIRNGRNQVNATTAWMKAQPEFNNIDQMVIMGCSAGSLGAQLYAPLLMRELGTTNENTVVIADSFVGLSLPVETEPLHQGQYQILTASTTDGEAQCFNVSENSGSVMKVSNPLGNVFGYQWDACDFLFENMQEYFTAEMHTQCQNQTLDITSVFNAAKTLGYPFHHIHSKGDAIQREFSTVLYAFGGTFAGSNTLNNQSPKLLTDLPSAAGDKNNYPWCSNINGQNATPYSYCQPIENCDVSEKTYSTYNYLSDFALMETDESDLNSYLIKVAKKIFSATSMGNALRRIGNRVLNSLSQFYMGNGLEDEEARGKYGESFFNGLAIKEFETAPSNVHWWMTDGEEHCFTCYDNMYVSSVNGIDLAQYISDAINGKSVQSVCDNDSIMPCPDRKS